MTTLAELDAYIEQLNNHDWSYEYSDDHKVWSLGLANRKALEMEAQRDSTLAAAHAAYCNWYAKGCDALEKVFRDAVIGGLRHDLKVEATKALLLPGDAVA